MGFPLDSTLADFFSEKIKEMVFINSNKPKPQLHPRCIDDVFAAIHFDCTRKGFLNALNLQHPYFKSKILKGMESLAF